MFFKLYRHFNINEIEDRFQILSIYSRTVMATDWDGKNIYQYYCIHYLLLDWKVIQLIHPESKRIEVVWLSPSSMFFETMEELEDFIIKNYRTSTVSE